GGRVVQLFLEFFWKDHQADYPELGKVIFFSSPLKGTPAADIVQSLRSNPGADEIARMADDLDAPGPDLRSPALEDLAESSDQSKYLAKKGLPDGVDALAIAGALDPIVPNDDATIDGAKTYLALPGNPVSPFDDHSGILHD